MVHIEKFELFTSPDKGRGIRATHDLSAGEEVFVEKPLVYTLTGHNYRGRRCDFCFAEPEELQKCSKCKFVFYCGRNCQLGDWPVHKRECKCLLKVSPKQPPDICRLVSHICFKYYWNKGENDVSGRSDIENLMGNREHITNSRKEAFFTFGAVLFEYLKDCPLKLKEADIYGLLCRISCNSFTITNSELNSLGTGVYKTASFINHSCDPNCIALFNGPDISIRCIKNIASGEELLMGYVNTLAPTELRKAELLEGYMFTCTCDVCSGKQLNDFLMKSIKCQSPCTCYQSLVEIPGFPSPKVCSCNKNCTSDKDFMKVASICSDELEALYSDIKVIPTSEQQKKLETLIKRGEKLLGPLNISLVRCYEVAMDGCLEQGLWRKALEYSKKLEKPYQMYLSKYHPSIGLHCFKQGKLEMQIDNVREGIASFQKAEKVLTISHGSNHKLLQMLRTSLAEASQEMVERQNYEIIERMYNGEE